jgi:hypothetical protein
MILVLPELADNAFEVLNSRPPGRIRAISFVYAPLPDRIIMNRTDAMRHDELVKLLTEYSGMVDYSQLQLGVLSWLGGRQDASWTDFDTNPTELSKLPDEVRAKLVQEIQRRLP